MMMLLVHVGIFLIPGHKYGVIDWNLLNKGMTITINRWVTPCICLHIRLLTPHLSQFVNALLCPYVVFGLTFNLSIPASVVI